MTFALIETFLTVNSADIPVRQRARARQAATRAILNESEPIDLAPIPAHLRDAFRRIVIESAYQYRNQGKMFNPKQCYMPTSGTPNPSSHQTQ